MTYNAILTGPAWQAPIDLPKSVRLILEGVASSISIEWANAGEDGDAPPDEMIGHAIPPPTARTPNVSRIVLGMNGRIYLRARGLAEGSTLRVPYTYVDPIPAPAAP